MLVLKTVTVSLSVRVMLMALTVDCLLMLSLSLFPQPQLEKLIRKRRLMLTLIAIRLSSDADTGGDCVALAQLLSTKADVLECQPRYLVVVGVVEHRRAYVYPLQVS